MTFAESRVARHLRRCASSTTRLQTFDRRATTRKQSRAVKSPSKIAHAQNAPDPNSPALLSLHWGVRARRLTFVGLDSRYTVG